jgi:hypothetical protein
MLKTTCVALSTLMAPLGALAAYTGADWYGRCVTGYKHDDRTMTPDERYQTGACNGELFGAGNVGACIPENTTAGDIKNVVVAYMQRHPETFTQSPYGTMNAATRQAWPCRR